MLIIAIWVILTIKSQLSGIIFILEKQLPLSIASNSKSYQLYYQKPNIWL